MPCLIADRDPHFLWNLACRPAAQTLLGPAGHQSSAAGPSCCACQQKQQPLASWQSACLQHPLSRHSQAPS
jgi:hypothetical protein